MNDTHDAFRQFEYIKQALSQNKKSIGFFIGAGCPLSVRIYREENGKKISEPLIQDVTGLTQRISEKLKTAENGKESLWDKIINLINEDGKDTSNNIECILTTVRALKDVAGKGNVRGFSAENLDMLDKEICKIISEEVSKLLPNKSSPYHNLAIWARSIKRAHPVHIFTTNYDLLTEQAFEESSAPYFDGFVGTRKAFFDLSAVENEQSLPARWTRLWKIHGSLNWRLDSERHVIRSDDKIENNEYLIYPSHLKYDQSRKMPYLAMLDRLKDFLLKDSSILFICGYSFSDQHINDILCSSLAGNPTSMIYAFIFGSINDPKYKEARKWALRTPNLSLIAFDGAIIGRNEAKWAPYTHHKEENNISKDIIIPIENKEKSEIKDTEFQLGNFLKFSILLKNLSNTSDNNEM